MAITTYVDFVNNYLIKNGMIGNATNINKAPDQLKVEIDEINTANSAANILIKLKTVDGSGSGLDADLLDGKESTNANTINTIVARDASGNFSAGTVTAALSGNATTATTLQTARTINGVSFNGSANINIEDRLGTSIASAATTTVGTAGLGDYMHITGVATITSLGTAASAGIRRTLIFDGALTVTHNATSLICPGAANIVTVAGTVIEVVAETTSNWRVVSVTHPSLSMAELGYLNGVTSAVQTQMDLKAPLASPALTGTPTAPTPAQFDNATSIATTAFVRSELGSIAGVGAGYSTSTTIPPSDVGKQIFFQNSSSVFTLPLTTSCRDGAIVYVSGNNNGGTISTQGSDIINIGHGGNVTSVYLSAVDTALFMKVYSYWYLLGGTLFNKYSTGFLNNMAASGYQKLPSGLIIQWGVVGAPGGVITTYLFPLAFPNTGFAITATFAVPAAGTANADMISNTQFRIQNTFGGPQTTSWIAIGY